MMEKFLIFKTRDELIRIQIDKILYFEADRNYTKLILSSGIQFVFSVNIGKIEEILAKQIQSYSNVLLRVGKSHIINKMHILQINIPKTKLVFTGLDGKAKELIVPKEPLKVLKETLEKEFSAPKVDIKDEEMADEQ
ncbi:hypothetical protein AwDysgo_08030 [Bacteroidales bacterium]|nr:hypothetical protein AwDysgo_08030 [Bacteroidales bacterium]